MSEGTRIAVKLGDESYVFDRNELTLTDLYAIKSATGLDFNPFAEGITEGNPVAVQGLIWFLRHKAGKNPGDPKQIDFKLGDLDIGPAADVDPTAASSGSGDADTSDDSPTTAT